MALVHGLFELKKRELIQDLVLVHANYHLRGQDSVDDQLFCEELASAFGVRIYCQDFFIEKNSSHIQKKARDFRRKFLQEIALHENGTVTLAHHQDDLFETVLFRLFRGANLKTLLPFKEFDGIVWRPLINLSKPEILNILKQNNIPFRLDSSNSESDYKRNALRHQVIPHIINEFPDAKKKIMDLAQSVQSLVEVLLPDLSETEDQLVIPENIPLGVLKIWVYEHIQKRLPVFHSVSEEILKNIVEKSDYFVNISDHLSVRKSNSLLQFIKSTV